MEWQNNHILSHLRFALLLEREAYILFSLPAEVDAHDS